MNIQLYLAGEDSHGEPVPQGEDPVEYGFYTYGKDTPWEDVLRWTENLGIHVSKEDLGWGTAERRFMVIPSYQCFAPEGKCPKPEVCDATANCHWAIVRTGV